MKSKYIFYLASIIILILITETISFKFQTRSRLGNCNTFKGKISVVDRQIILNGHNWLRNAVALKEVPIKNSFPFAKNMMQIYWSDRLAANAQRWANQCRFEYSSSENRGVLLGNGDTQFNAGENIFKRSSTGTYPVVDWEFAVATWFVEMKRFQGNTDVFNFVDGTNHFTQMIWANTYLIGCGFAQYMEGTNFSNLYVCHYGPEGNLRNFPIYRSTDRKGCECPKNTSCSSDMYPGLCCPDEHCNWTTQNYKFEFITIKDTVPNNNNYRDS
jgi:hypothetical protein